MFSPRVYLMCMNFIIIRSMHGKGEAGAEAGLFIQISPGLWDT